MEEKHRADGRDLYREALAYAHRLGLSDEEIAEIKRGGITGTSKYHTAAIGVEHSGYPDKLMHLNQNPIGRNKRSVWTVTTKPYSGAHFATFPPDLIEPCILAGSRPGDWVLDPFGGSGTTLAVAIKHHRNGIACELNPEYIDLMNKRLSNVQPVLFAASVQP